MLLSAQPSFSGIFQTELLIVYIVLSIAGGIMMYFSSIKFLLVLQQCGYHGTKYFKWIGDRNTPYLRRLLLLCLMGFLFSCVLSICFQPICNSIFSSESLANSVAAFIGFISYFTFTGIYIDSEYSINAKVPLRKTARLVRLCIVFAVFLILCTFGFMVLIDLIAFAIGDATVSVLRFSLICLMPLLCPLILFLAYCFIEPFEWVLRTHHIKMGLYRLYNTKALKIGITGSYGKTSVKEILKTILSQKYRVLATPRSYNTPLGIAITTKQLDSTHDIFIAEMGARGKGDIMELTKMVKPSIGIITGINNQHQETFKTIENTMDTKYELVENMEEKGCMFFSADNEKTRELYEKCPLEKYSVGITSEDGDITVSDIETTNTGTKFKLIIKGEEPEDCSTVLLGKSAISNICLAAAVARKIGMTANEIAQGINRVRLIGHRLEIVPNNRGIVIIDDSYNSNVDGVISAMEVLDLFDGRKIVLTPGLVELGAYENVANLELGKILAKHADIVIVIGTHNGETIINGLFEGGMDRKNIIFARTLKRGNEELNKIVKENDIVLFENDLPDNYN